MAQYEVSNPFQAFATAFLNQSAAYIKERKSDANEAKDRMYELAQRNKGKVDQYMLAVNNVGNVAEKLHKNYDIPKSAIVALNKTGPTALTDAYTQLEKMAAKHSREFVSQYADMIIEGYDPDEFDTGTPFREQIESQFTSGISVGDYEADERSWWDKAIGRGAKDSMREALDKEILSSGMSVYDMANFSEASAYRRASGDTTFSMPRIMSGEDRIEIQDDFLLSLSRLKSNTPQLSTLEASIEENREAMEQILKSAEVSVASVESLKTTDPDAYDNYMAAKARYENALTERASFLKPQTDQRLRSIASQYDDPYEALMSMQSTFDSQLYPGYTRQFLAENNIRPLSGEVSREPTTVEEPSVPESSATEDVKEEVITAPTNEDSLAETEVEPETSLRPRARPEGVEEKDPGVLVQNYSTLPPHESVFRTDFEINGKTLEIIKLDDGNLVVVNKTDSVVHTPEYSKELLEKSNIRDAMLKRYGPSYSRKLTKGLARDYDELKEEAGSPLNRMLAKELYEGSREVEEREEEAIPPVEEEPEGQEADDITNFFMDNFGMDIVMYVMRQGATTDEQIYHAIKSWARENEKITPMDMSGIIYGVKVGMNMVRRQANE